MASPAFASLAVASMGLASLAFASTAGAAALNVQGDSPNAQAAMDAATPQAVLPSFEELVARSYSMPEGTPRHTVYYDTATGKGGIPSGPTPEGFDNPVYANEPPPAFVFPPGPNRLIADDLIMVAVGGCSVSGYEFRVGRSANRCSLTGAACDTVDDCSGTTQTCDPRPDSGFTVDFALYDGCPGLGGQIIPGTVGTITFVENGLFTVLVDFGGNNIPTESTVWLGVEFDKVGAGWVVGTPASTGFTENIYHHPNIPCFANFGAFGIYAGFHAKVFCSATPPFEREFLAYFNPELDAPLFAPGGGQWMADDVTLIVDDCILTSYEIGSVGTEPYTVTAEIWRFCSQATLVPGTHGVFQGTGGGTPELARFSFPGGIQLDNGANYWVAWKYDNDTSAIISGEPILGESADLFALPGIGCGFFFGGPPNPYASFNLTIRCLGDPPLGACCDLSTVPVAGSTPLCREVPKSACLGPLTRYNQGARCPLTCSVDGAECALDTDCALVCSVAGTPCVDAADCSAGETCDMQLCLELGVAFTPPCGTSACCTPPEFVGGGEGCFHMPRDECLAILDSQGNSAVWQRANFCNVGGPHCIRWSCRFAEGVCNQPHGTAGCNNPACCDTVCAMDSFCCEIEWDSTCVSRAIEVGGGCTLCGDGIIDTGEQCDDAGESAMCDVNCTVAECGDGTLNASAGEVCDDGMANSDTAPDACRTNCLAPSCGDTVTDTGEQCDVGPDVFGDCCAPDCQYEGTGSLCGQPPAECSDQDTCDDGGNCNANDTPAGSPCGAPADMPGSCFAGDACSGGGVCLPGSIVTACIDNDFCCNRAHGCSAGNDNDCEQNVPTVSTWGLLVLALMLAAAAKGYFGARRLPGRSV